jgi:hypothetical protein
LIGGAAKTQKLTTDVLVAYLSAATQNASECIALPRASPPSHEDTATGQEQRSHVASNHSATASCWAVALSSFVRIRTNPVTRRCVELTPQVLERLSELAERGKQWHAAVRIVSGAAALHLLVPPESYDAAIRACYRSKEHALVVRLVERCLATRTPPDETSVRMALRSTEEVAAEAAQDSLLTTVPLMSGFLSSKEEGSSSNAASWALAVRLYQGLKDNGLALLPQTFEVPIRVCSASGKWDMAARILTDMKTTFHRRVPSHAYRTVLLSKVEHAPSYDIARRLFEVPIVDKKSTTSYLALLRCCVRLNDWKHFKVVRLEMKRHEIPETYVSMKLQMLLALGEGNPHAVATRYMRWVQQTDFEKGRVAADEVVPLHADDFDMEEGLLRLVISACERLMKESKAAMTKEGKHSTLDPVIPAAHADALKRLSGGRGLLQQGKRSSTTRSSPSSGAPESSAESLPSWLFVDRVDRDDTTTP